MFGGYLTFLVCIQSLFLPQQLIVDCRIAQLGRVGQPLVDSRPDVVAGIDHLLGWPGPFSHYLGSDVSQARDDHHSRDHGCITGQVNACGVLFCMQGVLNGHFVR